MRITNLHNTLLNYISVYTINKNFKYKIHYNNIQISKEYLYIYKEIDKTSTSMLLFKNNYQLCYTKCPYKLGLRYHQIYEDYRIDWRTI